MTIVIHFIDTGHRRPLGLVIIYTQILNKYANNHSTYSH